MTPDEARAHERAEVVAWLRENIAECERLANWMYSNGSFADAAEMRQVGNSQLGIVKAIERGDHLKDK